ncbi:MAG: hypothetical protein GF331_07190 [Chitinivibrionales bacterium]|nr:hypothetical protein [Chitinivibrionales bacterium]
MINYQSAIALLFALACVAGQERSPDLILKNANRNENTLIRGELVSTLIGDVVFLYDDFTIYSDRARWWQSRGTVKLTGNVRVEREDEKMTCDRLTFLKKQKQLDASGRVNYYSHPDRVRIHGSHGRYDMDRDRFVLTGEPHFLRFDTAAAETLTIVGREMTYHDSTRVASAVRDVRITKGKLAATCERANYYTSDERAQLRGTPVITFDGNTMKGDSVDLRFRGDTLQGVAIGGSAHGLYLEPDSSDTNVTNVWGDSMYMAMTPSGSLDSLWAWEDVLSTYYLSSEADSANKVSGKAMVLSFEGSGNLRSALVWGNARSTYFVREDDGQGRNEASGDTIHVFFDEGKARELTISGSVRGSYFPQQNRGRPVAAPASAEPARDKADPG